MRNQVSAGKHLFVVPTVFVRSVCFVECNTFSSLLPLSLFLSLHHFHLKVDELQEAEIVSKRALSKLEREIEDIQMTNESLERERKDVGFRVKL